MVNVNDIGRADERTSRRWLSPRRADWLLCAAVVVTGAVQLGLTWSDPLSRLVVSTALIPACSLPLLYRRRYPGLVLLLAGVVFGILAVAGRLAAGLVGLQAAGYAAALYGPRW